LIDSLGKDWLEITAELDKLTTAAHKALRAGDRGNAHNDLTATWFARGQIDILERIRKLPDKTNLQQD